MSTVQSRRPAKLDVSALSGAPVVSIAMRIFRYHAARYEITMPTPRWVTRGIVTGERDGTALPSGTTCPSLTAHAETHRFRVVLG